MNTLTNTTEMSMVEIVTALASDNLNKAPSESNKTARVAPVMFTNGQPVLVLDAEQSGPDIYDLLDSLKPESVVNYYAVITTGWAAPLNDDGDTGGIAPSQHPQRKRVELMCIVSRDAQMASAMTMEGDDDIITDDGKATGSLQLALLDIFDR